MSALDAIEIILRVIAVVYHMVSQGFSKAQVIEHIRKLAPQAAQVDSDVADILAGGKSHG